MTDSLGGSAGAKHDDRRNDVGRVHEYDGDAIRVTYEPSRCIHAAECVRGLPAVFDTDRKPWIDASGAAADAIAEVIHRCPTGALKYRRTDGGAQERVGGENILTVSADGPLYARGDIEVLDSNRTLLSRETRAAFCRCGASKNKPWCDGSHADAGFRAPAELAEKSLKPPPDPAPGPLRVRLRENGPLVLEGPFRISGDDGNDRYGGGCALCRCGASAGKPWCDGSHNAIGFQAEEPGAG
jgi:CDGSH-type Zn-finger protein/uncharacterized Fe-S cluster protein YjdI